MTFDGYLVRMVKEYKKEHGQKGLHNLLSNNLGVGVDEKESPESVANRLSNILSKEEKPFMALDPEEREGYKLEVLVEENRVED